MSVPSISPARRLDAMAVDAAWRRLARGAGAPWLHGEVARRMAQRLEVIRLQPQRIIDWGAFLGAGGEWLDATYPRARRVVVEPHLALVERSREMNRLPWWSPRRWRRGGVDVMLESDENIGVAQLVWSNMLLHAVKDPPALMSRWQRALSDDGFVMFSCFGPGTLIELRALYRRLGWPAPTIDFVDMHDLGDMLMQAGFADPVMDQETLTLSWASQQALLNELRGLGSNASSDRGAGLRTPRWKAQLERELQALTGPEGRLTMSFEISYGHAFKAKPRVPPAASTSVSLDDMRALVRSAAKPRG